MSEEWLTREEFDALNKAIDETPPDSSNLPEGEYHCIVKEASFLRSSKKGTPGVELTFAIAEGKYEKCDVRGVVWLTEKNAANIRRTLANLGLTSTVTDLLKAAGKHCLVVVERDDYGPKMKWVNAFTGTVPAPKQEKEADYVPF